VISLLWAKPLGKLNHHQNIPEAVPLGMLRMLVLTYKDELYTSFPKSNIHLVCLQLDPVRIFTP